jgi:hypothetical protein
MLKRLGASVAEWKPPRKSAMPLDTLRVAWSQIVGAEVAKHSFPSDLRGDVLTVLTRSGTWSQQLGFLEANILQGVEQLGLGVPVAALRFRVGKIALMTPIRSARPRPTQQRLRLETPLPANATLEEILARIKERARVARRQRGPRCARCALRVERGRLCAPCRSNDRQERINRVLRIFTEVPWLGDDEVRASLGAVNADEIAYARRILLDRWRSELIGLERREAFAPGEPERAIAISYVQLETRLPPARMTRAIARDSLGPALDALLYGEKDG